MSNSNMLFEVRDQKSGRHLDFINANGPETAQAVFDFKYTREDGSSNMELHQCNVKSRPGRDGKPFVF